MFFEFKDIDNTLVRLDDIQYTYKSELTKTKPTIVWYRNDRAHCLNYEDEESRDKDYELLKQELLPKNNIEQIPLAGYLFTKDYNSHQGFTIYAGNIAEVKRIETRTTKSDVVIFNGEVIFDIGSKNAKEHGTPIFK